MKSKYLILSALAVASLLSCKGPAKPAAAEEREKWLLSLNDSIAAYKAEIDSANMRLDELHVLVGDMVGNFDHVSNPRLVEGYYIFKGWSSRYPLSSTGIVARITQDEGFEIIAALSGAHFNQIEVSAGGDAALSAVVPHDQALNYRAGALNTVCFYGSEADAIGELVSKEKDSPVSLTFLNGSKTGKIEIPAPQKEMIAATWQLFSAQRETHRLEKEIPLLSRRIDACRRMLEANDSTLNTK